MYSIDWARLRSVVAEREAVYGPSLAPPGSASTDLPDPESVASRALVSILKLFHLEESLTRIAGEHLEFLLRTHAYRRMGYSAFRDFAREELQMSSRTATRRIALSRVLRKSPVLSRAVGEGRLSSCQALALEPMEDSAELSEWVEKAAGLTVRKICAAIQERQEPQSLAEDSDASGRTVTFGATASAAYLWDHGIELARRVLGWEAPVYRCVEAVLAETATELSVGMTMDVSARSPAIVSVFPPTEPSHSPDNELLLHWSQHFEVLDESIVAAEEELRIIEGMS